MSDVTRQAFIIADFFDAGTGARYTGGSIVPLDPGLFANYLAARLVRDPTAGDVAADATWTDGTVAKDMRGYSDIEIQVAGLAPGDTIAVMRSLTGDAYAQQSWVSNSFANGDTVAGDGIYSFSGRAFFKFTKTGPGGAPTVVIRGSS